MPELTKQHVRILKRLKVLGSVRRTAIMCAGYLRNGRVFQQTARTSSPTELHVGLRAERRVGGDSHVVNVLGEPDERLLGEIRMVLDLQHLWLVTCVGVNIHQQCAGNVTARRFYTTSEIV